MAQLQAYDSIATVRSIPLTNKAYGNGGAVFDLPHAGIPTHITISFNGSLTVKNGTTVGTVTASPMWPFIVMGPSSLNDYSGNTRIFADGYSLYTRELVLGTALEPKVPYSQESYADQIYTASIPSGKASASVTSPVRFSVTFPVSLKSTTAWGSYDATVPKGTSQLIINESELTGPYINSPLAVSGSTVTLTGTWSAEYYYLDAPSSVAKPVGALAEIHEFYQQNTETDQIQAGGTPQQILLTGRTYYRVFQRLIADNKMDTLDIANVQFLVDSSTPTLNETLRAYLFNTRRRLNRDLPLGTIFWDFMSKPWSPNSYGSLTTQLTFNNSIVAGSYSQLVTTRETLYVPSGNLVSAGG
jgi:hypothetical protein